jgi:sulfoxide reductase heme-binding subunit YedZ
MSTAAGALGVHFFWITSRAAGVAALLASSAAVTLGLLMGGRLLKGRGTDLRVTHEALSLVTMVALAVHALALVGDGFLSPSLADVSLPLVWSYQRFWTTIGIVGGWGLIILGLTYYVRGRIGPARWKRMHRFTALAWLLGVAHGIGEGTDAGAAWFLVTMAAVVLPAAALLVARLSQRPAAASAA